MGMVIESYYKEPRPIIVMVKNTTQENNFYDDMMKFNSKHMSFVKRFLRQQGKSLNRANLRDLLSFKGDPQGRSIPSYGPVAPFRVYNYSTSAAFSSPLLNKPYIRPGTFDNCLVIIDEAHNLWCHPDDFAAPQRANCEKILAALKKSKNMKLVMATGTPLVKDFDRELKEIKEVLKVKGNEEGFVSYFMGRTHGQFAEVPEGLQTVPKIHVVELQGVSQEIYLEKRCGKPKLQKARPKTVKGYKLVGGGFVTPKELKDNPTLYGKTPKERKAKGKLEFNGNKMVRATQTVTPPPVEGRKCNNVLRVTDFGHKELQKFENVSNGNLVNKSVLKSQRNLMEMSSKFAAIVNFVMSNQAEGKIAIHIYKRNGLLMLVRLLQQKLGTNNVGFLLGKGDTQSRAQYSATKDRYNDIKNSLGEKMKVIVLEGGSQDEAVSLYDVRHMILPDLSPSQKEPKWQITQQRIARALRMCGHQRKGTKITQPILNVHLFVATLGPAPPGYEFPVPRLFTVDETKLVELKRNKDKVDENYARLEKMAADRSLYVSDFFKTLSKEKKAAILAKQKQAVQGMQDEFGRDLEMRTSLLTPNEISDLQFSPNRKSILEELKDLIRSNVPRDYKVRVKEAQQSVLYGKKK